MKSLIFIFVKFNDELLKLYFLCRITHYGSSWFYFSDHKAEGAYMRATTHRHTMTYNSRCMNVYFVFYYNATYTCHMSINTIPTTNLSIMPYDRIRLNHIVITDYCIVSNDRVCTDKISFT